MKYLITGCDGFLGSHLADFLVARKAEIHGMVFGHIENISHLDGQLEIREGDLRDRERVANILKEIRPDVIFHLAAQSLVTVSWQNPEDTLRTNILGTFHLLESLRLQGSSPLIILVGSSAVFGPHAVSKLPLKEEDDFRPTSMYAVSKIGEEMLGSFYWRVFGARIIRVRPFNMTGPRKTHDACSDFARGIVEIERGRRAILHVGNLEAIRDFTDGRDAVRALWTLVERGVPGEVYNLCSGTPRPIKDVLTALSALSTAAVRYETVAEKMRPYDDPAYVGDNLKLRALGWEPRIPLEKTLADILDYWRNRIQ